MYVGSIDIEDAPTIEPRPSVLTDKVTNPFVPLLMFYAEKALDFPLAEDSTDSRGREEREGRGRERGILESLTLYHFRFLSL